MALRTDYTNTTVLTDLHPDAHNDTNVAVNLLDGRVDTIETGGGGGATILNGAGTPAGGTGSDGDYYLDTTGHILYGPKATTWPVALVGIPPGGTTGQSLKKTSATDYAVGWVT